MEKVEGCRRRLLAAVWFIMALEFCLFLSVLSLPSPARKNLGNNSSHALGPRVQLQVNDDKQVVISNGMIQASFSKPDGFITRISYKGIDNVLETQNKENDRGYWDVVWGEENFDKLSTTNFKVVTLDDDQAEVSFSKTWDSRHPGTLPLNVDKRFVVRRGCPGIYIYAIMERGERFPAAQMYQIRVVFKLRNTKFHYMAISENKQRVMPSAQDRDATHSQVLAFKEAVLLTNPTNPALRGQVDDKYQYSMEDKDTKVHGWISASNADDEPAVGVWMITPSDEFRVAGPLKQDLTSHVGPTTLNMFVSTHYIGLDLDTSYREGETWKKVFGPVLLYLNSAACKGDPKKTLWNDAKKRMLREVESWPYNFPESQEFAKADKRGTVWGQLLVQDGNKLVCAGGAYIGLAAPGEPGSWQKEGKGYQFWTRTGKDGRFVIKNIRPGIYNLYAWVTGFIGDYKLERVLTIEQGSNINLGALKYFPPRNGPTLWEIGIPDRTAGEFFIPDPYPTLVNPLYINHPHEKYRQYGLWDRYSEIYREHDLIYDVDVSDYAKDWFFAHVTRNIGNNTCEGTTWQIKFELKDVKKGKYTLQLALASAAHAHIQVRVNDPDANPALFVTGQIGSDNAIARHGIHGLYRLYSIDVDNSKLERGSNRIYLSQSGVLGPFDGVMYDYIRLEEPRP